MNPTTPKYCQCKYPLIRVDPFNKEYCGKCDRYFEELKTRKMKPITPQKPCSCAICCDKYIFELSKYEYCKELELKPKQ